MIDIIIDYVVKLIMGTFEKMMYVSRKSVQVLKINKAKQEASDAKEDSDSATSEFRIKLQQYRKSRADLRQTVERVRDRSRQAGADDSKAGKSDQDSK